MWFGTGMITVLLYAAASSIIEQQNAILTESSNALLTENSDTIVTE